LKEERRILQFRVLAAKYGEVGDGERIALVWRKNLSGIRSGSKGEYLVRLIMVVGLTFGGRQRFFLKDKVFVECLGDVPCEL